MPFCVTLWPLQVAPSFFDAPGAQESMPSSASSGLVTASSVASVSPANTRRFSADLPNITFAFASEVGYKVRLWLYMGVQLLSILLLCEGMIVKDTISLHMQGVISFHVDLTAD